MTFLQYRFLRSASADLDVIWESIAQDNPEAADRTVNQIYEQVRLLAKYPDAGHSRPDLAGKRSLLFSSIGRYLIIYRKNNQSLQIIAVLHASRDVPKILRHRKPDE